ncbi:hypothetical protein EIP86_005926 [Pleurotus ostreatoroseus]|nr:hypothetical protein EIP86_005926 [Pleurotus ostreatoroseus]
MARFRAYSSDSEDEEEFSNEGVEEAQASSELDDLPQESTPPRQSRGLQPDSDEDSDMYDEDEAEIDQELRYESPQPPAHHTADPSIIPWARELGVDPHKMHVMQASLFRMPEEASAMKVSAPPPPGPRRKLDLTNPLRRKHSRDSDGDGSRGDSRQRASFADDVEPTPFRPTRKYARVESAASFVAGQEGTLIDSGLSLGRSFRVGWGPGGQLAHLGALCAPWSDSKDTANSSVVKVTNVPLIPILQDSTLEAETERVSKVLSQNLSHTVIEPDADGIPIALPSRRLTFASFASLFPDTERSFEATLFRLGHALFDPLELHLKDPVHENARLKATVLRRKAVLSKWLQGAVAASVESDLRDAGDADWAAMVFALMTGNQVEKACDTALDAENVKLATLLSQAGGDEEFKADLRSQLAIWRDEKIDVHIPENVRKIYALLAGVVDVLEGSKGAGLERCPDVPLTQGLDWKRVFGLHLWYGQPLDASIADAFDAYNVHQEDAQGPSTLVAPPLPWYSEASLSSTWKLPTGPAPPDALYSLIKLFADPTCSLSQLLSPLSFSPSPVDSRLPWHIYIIMSRCLRVRDFADRGDPGVQRSDGDDGDVEVEGHSPSADLLASSYALQLEQLGMLQEAAFVLLHIEGSSGRRRAIKELLTRNAPKLDDWMTRGLVGSLKIPMSWVNEAKVRPSLPPAAGQIAQKAELCQAIHALNRGDLYDAYELYLSAGLYNSAHELAVLELAPDAVIRQDLELLKGLFDKIAGHPVDNWQIRGKAFLDYAHAMIRLPELRDRLEDAEAPSDDSIALEVEELTRSVPKLIGVLTDALRDRTDVRHNAALTEMISGLTVRLDQLRPLALGPQIRTANVAESTKLHHIRSTAYEKFLRTIEVV